MILKILIYFFLIFGIADFILMIWQKLLTGSYTDKKAFIVLPYDEVKKHTYETFQIIKNSPYRIYIIFENEKDAEIYCKKYFKNAQTGTTEQLTEELKNIYGNDNR